jgi:VIT1/CCC1 family predicted Fe2+/Mn2+ transporter
MNLSVLSGVSFGLASGVITTLGLMVGLHAGTHSLSAVAGGIVTIAIADALSDALGMHVAQESQNRYTAREVWLATAVTFVTKFAVALTFLVPVFFLTLDEAVVASVAWGMILIILLSERLARRQGVSPWGVIAEHLLVAIAVVAITHYAGHAIGALFAD